MGKIKIIKYVPKHRLSEIYQQVGIQFAFLSNPRKGYKQCHQFVLCRDFLHDAVRATINKDLCNIYEFIYSPHEEDTPVDVRKMRMLVRSATDLDEKGQKEFRIKMERAKRLLNHYERLAGWTGQSKILRIIGDDQIWLFSGPSKWMLSSYLVSMYSYVIRLGDKGIKEFNSNNELVEEYQRLLQTYDHINNRDNDLTYLSACIDKLHLVAKYYKELFDNRRSNNYPAKYCNHKTFHDQGGILSLCKFDTYDKELNLKFLSLYEQKIR